MTLTDFEKYLADEGYDVVTTVTQPAGYAMGDHAHAFDACALILAGHITLTVAGQETRYASGDVFHLPAATPHLESALPEGVSYRVGRRSPASSNANQSPGARA